MQACTDEWEKCGGGDEGPCHDRWLKCVNALKTPLAEQIKLPT